MAPGLTQTAERSVQSNRSPWRTRLEAGVAADFSESGQWLGVTLVQQAATQTKVRGATTAIVDGKGSQTFAEIMAEARLLAGWFRQIGLAPGEVVSFQLPNWSEAIAINLAACMCGLVVNPIVPIYRDVEVGYILRSSRTRIVFIPETFRATDYVEMVENLRPSLPDLEAVVVVRGTENRSGVLNYGRLLAEAPQAPGFAVQIQDPNAVKLLLYTSGTTGRPKGVLHSHNTIQSEIDAVGKFWGIQSTDVILMPSPVTHITGYIYGIEMMATFGCKAVFMDRWDAELAAALILQHGVTFSVGATPFLRELVGFLEHRGETRPSLRLFACGGAPVAPDDIRRARAVLPNCLAFRIYGSSEAPTVTAGVAAGDPVELGATTDGAIVNFDVKIVSPDTGETLGDGREGEILVRGPELMLGYTEWEDTVEAFDAEGYFRTGDLGFISHARYVTVSGRKKDLIIRGGENISAKEVEDILHTHPAIAEVAVVAMPHERLGETPCAFAVLNKGGSLTIQEVQTFLEDTRLAKQKFPENLFLLASMPKTASGKIQKHVLRARCKTDT
ncbi:AMP-binding protein [Novosphingobium tardum]|uniref:AMP-binding protein n=1 Tax=Novosphingobium tardum TaxID=1538021 RepID=A0ABV8RRA8_9SPHN